MKYVIGTGWWCDGTGEHTHTNHQKYVDKETRKKDFFNLWYKAVKKFTKPQKIIMIDSNSPIKPNISNKKDVSIYELSKNFGASLDGTKNKRLSGWDRSILGSASLSFLEDCEYFVYIEQDCLIYGKNIIEKAIKSMGKKPMLLGSGNGTPQPIQQSFVIIKKDFIHKFLQMEFNLNKNMLSIDSEKRYSLRFKGYYDFLPFGYGRKRPIDFNQSHFYVQHLRTNELSKLKKMI